MKARHQQFADAFLTVANGNATKAALAIGCSEASASVLGSRMLRREDVQAYLAKKAEKAEKPKKEKQAKEKGARFTEEGFRIYSTEELNIGKGGDTADCPIDCNCCF